MIRTFLVVLAVALAAGCSSESGDSQPVGIGPGSDRGPTVPIQLSQGPEVTVDRILQDLIGKNVSVQDAAGQSQPMDWVFEADEPKDAEIIESRKSDTGLSVVIQLNTGGAPGSQDANVQLSGRLMLNYQWNGRDWVLREIRNITFRFSRRMSI